jgi:hypothetical protein
MKWFSDIGLGDQAISQLCTDIVVCQRQYPFSGDDHDVLRGRQPGFVQSEELAQKALDPVSPYGVPRFPADRHAQSSDSRPVPACDDRKTRRVSPYPLLIDPRIILSFPNALIFAKGLGFHVVPPLFRGLTDLPLVRPPGLNRQFLPPLRPPSAENSPAAFGGHPDEKAVGAFSLGVAENCQILFHSLKLRLKLIAACRPYRRSFVKAKQGEL